MGISKGMDVKSVWNYSDRTLTQEHFPFWTEVITQQHGSITVNSNSYVEINIQPASNETWLLIITGYFGYNDANLYILYRQYDGSHIYADYGLRILGTYGRSYPSINITKVLTDTLYASIYARNPITDSKTFRYGYSGFKLGTKIAGLEEIETAKTIQSERLTKYKIKSEFEGLEDLIRDVYDDTIDDYKQVIYFYKDKPIRKDKKTGHIIERVSSYIETDKLIENLGKIRTGELNLERTGYKTWLEQIRKERGIDLLGRL